METPLMPSESSSGYWRETSSRVSPSLFSSLSRFTLL